MTDNLRWEAKVFIVGSSSVSFHAISMPEISLVGKLTISPSCLNKLGSDMMSPIVGAEKAAEAEGSAAY